VAPSDAAEKNRNMGAHCTATIPQRCLGKHFLCDFWCAQTCSFRAVFEIHIRTFTIVVSAI